MVSVSINVDSSPVNKLNKQTKKKKLSKFRFFRVAREKWIPGHVEASLGSEPGVSREGGDGGGTGQWAASPPGTTGFGSGGHRSPAGRGVVEEEERDRGRGQERGQAGGERGAAAGGGPNTRPRLQTQPRAEARLTQPKLHARPCCAFRCSDGVRGAGLATAAAATAPAAALGDRAGGARGGSGL
jgi:hypothetical protein